MIWFYMYFDFNFDYNPQLVWLSLFFYLINLSLFFFTRFNLFAKSLIILSSFSLCFILWTYSQAYIDIIDRELSLSIEFQNILISLPLPEISLGLELNQLTYLFSLLVFIIGFLTNIYTLNYFKFEADDLGFLFWLNAFIASMALLVLSSNFFTLFLGWELIGLTSFFLINFWGVRRATLKSSFKAFSFNLLSDLFLLSALVILYNAYQTSSISELSALISLSGGGLEYNCTLPAIFLVMCASIKSVQILGHLWLPDSMEAPVPASSLIHSATLVSAGVFLLLRFNFILVEANIINIVCIIGSITAAYGAIVSAAQTDVKKLLAYSTMSHCGFLFITVGLMDFRITIVYLFLHGLFKAGTFFCVGSLIRLYGTQDTRLMGGVAQLYWGDSILLLCCSVNLCGLPLTIGASYKIYFMKLLLGANFGPLCLGLIFIAMLFSLIYFYRLIFYSLFDIWKNLWGTSPLFLEVIAPFSKKDKRDHFFRSYYIDNRFMTYSHWTATTLLLIFSFWVYRTILFNFEATLVDSSLISSTQQISNLLLEFVPYLYRYYLIYFYSLYLLILLLILLVTWRRQTSYKLKLNLFFYLIIFSLTGLILICGALY